MNKCKKIYVESVPYSELAMYMRVAGNPAIILGHNKYGGVVAKVRNNEGKEWVTWGGKNELAPPRCNEDIEMVTPLMESTSDETRIMTECEDEEIEE